MSVYNKELDPERLLEISGEVSRIANTLARLSTQSAKRDDSTVEAGLAAEISGEPRLHVVHGRLPFDDFDALLSFATVVIGNDSGPKHLASLRGTPTVTLFSARINWTEWAQENVGTVISRKLPCAGCAILHNADECGRGYACVTDIKVEEVVDAALAYVQPEDRR